jgi:hypothetical protein
MDQPDDLLQVVAKAMAGENGCCGLWDPDGRCCMTASAKRVFAAIADYGGPTLKECEAVARGDARVMADFNEDIEYVD